MCPDCKKERYTRDGWYHGKHEKRQRYKCTICKRRFRDNLGFEYRQVPHLYITLALMLCGMGMAAANIQMTLKYLGVGVHEDTITRILGTLFHYSKVVAEYAGTVKPPCVGDKWGCDEKHQKVRGKESYMVAVMDLATRFMLAWDTSPTKEKYDAVPCCGRPGTWRARSHGCSSPTASTSTTSHSRRCSARSRDSGPYTYATSTSGTSYATPTNRSASTGGSPAASGTPAA